MDRKSGPYLVGFILRAPLLSPKSAQELQLQLQLQRDGIESTKSISKIERCVISRKDSWTWQRRFSLEEQTMMADTADMFIFSGRYR